MPIGPLGSNLTASVQTGGRGGRQGDTGSGGRGDGRDDGRRRRVDGGVDTGRGGVDSFRGGVDSGGRGGVDGVDSVTQGRHVAFPSGSPFQVDVVGSLFAIQVWSRKIGGDAPFCERSALKYFI